MKDLDPSTCSLIDNRTLIDSCYFKVATKSNDSILCEKVKSVGTKLSCIGRVARYQRNEGICEQMTFQFAEDMCKERVKEQREEDKQNAEESEEINDQEYNVTEE